VLVDGRPAYPFQKLVGNIERRTGARFDRVLIPLGRSLQRSSGGPEFFKHPRAVVALDAESSNAFNVPVKDRLYMGYQERASVIEVISYNEQAGRFEFQVVKNYEAGSVPSVTYANRFLCTHCHQNQAPLFSRQLWDETNANPRVSHLLKTYAIQFHGIPSGQDADVPYRIDKAVHRSNEFSIYQRIWRAGLGTNPNDLASVQMRAVWLENMIRFRMSGSTSYDRSSPSFMNSFVRPLSSSLKARFPTGMAISNPEIPNRSPLAVLSREASMDNLQTQAFLSARQQNIEAQFEPANPRAPLEMWNPDDAAFFDHLVMGGALLFSQADIRRFESIAGSLSARIQRLAAEAAAGNDALLAAAFRPHTICERLVAMRDLQ
jgi:hypothetical protein